MTRFLNAAIRISALGIRFLFVFFLAKSIDAGSVGYYGLFNAAVAFAMVFVGLEFYVFVTRDLLTSQPDMRGGMLKGHAALSAFLYLALLPLVALFLHQADWPGHLYLWFLPILFLEHINQEIYRLLVTMSEQISASALLFVRQASWAIVIIAVVQFSVLELSLDMIMLAWLTAGIATVVLGLLKVRTMEIGGWRAPISWTWVRRGILIATPFLFATLAQRGIFTFDRYWLEAISGPETVGAYVLFFGLASALTVMLDAAVFSFIYPELIKLNHEKQYEVAKAKVRLSLFQTVALSAAFALISWLILPLLLGWIENAIYLELLWMYPGVLLAVVLFGIGQVPHWGLYARGKDKVLVLGNLLALSTFVVTTWMAGQTYGAQAVLFGINAAFSAALIWKAAAYIKLAYFETE